MTATLERTFSSLRVPNYRKYFTGQVISITGNWMQIVGEMWLMVKLTGSGVSVGLTAACSSCRSCCSVPGAGCSPTGCRSGRC